MSGLPIRDLDQLLAAVQSLVTAVQSSTRLQYSYTYETGVTEVSSSPKKIIDLPSDNAYKILIENFSANIIYLRVGPGGENLTVGASALIIKPSKGKTIEVEGSYELWFISETNSSIAITILSEKPNLGNNEEMPIPLNAVLRVGAGEENVGEHTPLSILEALGSDWYDIGYDTLISDQGLSVGYKILKLQSFQPKETYEFKIEVASDATIDWDTNRLKPIEVYLFEFDQVSLAKDVAIAAMRGDLAYDDLQHAVKQIMTTTKNDNTFVEKFPTTGGTFSISPGNSQNLIHITVRTESMGGQGAVLTSYDDATRTITVGGY